MKRKLKFHGIMRLMLSIVYILILPCVSNASCGLATGACHGEAGLTSETEDSTSLLQGPLGVHAQLDPPDSHGSNGLGDCDEIVSTASRNDCNKHKQNHETVPKAVAQVDAPRRDKSLAMKDLSDYVAAIQLHVRQRLAGVSQHFLIIFLLVLLVISCCVLFAYPVQSFALQYEEEEPLKFTNPGSGHVSAAPPPASLRLSQSTSSPQKNTPRLVINQMIQQARGRTEEKARWLHQAQVRTEARAAEILRSEIPPLCPKLPITGCEARFLIPIEALAALSKGGHLKFDGPLDTILFEVHVRVKDGYKLLEMKLCSDLSSPIATIQLDYPSSAIRGAGGVLYGLLEMRNSNPYEVTRDGRTLFLIEADTAKLMLTLRAPFGILATVSCDKQIDINVREGSHIILCVACILACLMQPKAAAF